LWYCPVTVSPLGVDLEVLVLLLAVAVSVFGLDSTGLGVGLAKIVSLTSLHPACAKTRSRPNYYRHVLSSDT